MIHPDIAPAMSAGIFLQFVRRSIADEIERLIAILDSIDVDCDLEDSDDDANLAGDFFGDERELDDTDSEPSLGWPNPGFHQIGMQDGAGWCGDSYGDDRKGDEADREPDNEDSDEYNQPPFELVQHEMCAPTIEQWIAIQTGGAA